MSDDEQIKALHAVRTAHRRIAEKTEAEHAAVVAAREQGVPWRAIADALGMSQPNASRAYGPLPRPVSKAGEEQTASAIRKIKLARKAILDAELREVHAVAAARAVHVTWAAIATEVEMEQPNAVARFKALFTEDLEVRPDVAERLRERRGKPRGSRSAGTRSRAAGDETPG